MKDGKKKIYKNAVMKAAFQSKNVRPLIGALCQKNMLCNQKIIPSLLPIFLASNEENPEAALCNRGLKASVLNKTSSFFEKQMHVELETLKSQHNITQLITCRHQGLVVQTQINPRLRLDIEN